MIASGKQITRSGSTLVKSPSKRNKSNQLNFNQISFDLFRMCGRDVGSYMDRTDCYKLVSKPADLLKIKDCFFVFYLINLLLSKLSKILKQNTLSHDLCNIN